MPLFANYLNPNGAPIKASAVLRSQQKRPFFCCTEHCSARMILVNGGNTKDAFFRSKDRSEHISNDCIKNALVFNESDYNEAIYDNNFAFESILGLNHNGNAIYRGETGTRLGTVGGSRNMRIHTLPKLVAMCLHRGKEGFYNGFPIDDILVDEENYNRYKEGIRGYRVVEVSYYKKVYNEYALLFNYPVNNRGIRSWVKVVFPVGREDLFWNQYRKCKSDTSHSKALYIAGNWQECCVADGDRLPHSFCIISSPRQIYWAVV